MGRKLEEIAAEALELDLDARAALAKRLLESLDELSAEENERLWSAEAAQRYEEIREGRVETFAADEVHREINEDLERRRQKR